MNNDRDDNGLRQFLKQCPAVFDEHTPPAEDAVVLRLILRHMDTAQINGLFYALRYRPEASRTLYLVLTELLKQKSGMTEAESKAYADSLTGELEANQYISSSFFSVLVGFVDRAGMTDPDVYNAIGMNRRLWYRLRDNKKASTSKSFVLKMAITLHLDYYEAHYLLNLAGYTFMVNSVTDHVVEYCLRKEIYDPIEVDELLVKHNEKPLYSEDN